LIQLMYIHSVLEKSLLWKKKSDNFLIIRL
jgi:hypothetical protein